MRKVITTLLLLLVLLFDEGTAMALTNGSATIGWFPTSDATIRYELRWKSFANSAWQTIATNLDSTIPTYAQTFSPVQGTDADRWACWDARAAQTTNGVTLYSAWLSDLNQQVCNQVPGASIPTNLAATAASSSQINLAWSASTDTISILYLVERCQGAFCSTFAQVSSGTTISLLDTGLTASTSYSYRVRATDANNIPTSYSNIASATTLAIQPPPPIHGTVLF